jgi:hypothetical protein
MLGKHISKDQELGWLRKPLRLFRSRAGLRNSSPALSPTTSSSSNIDFGSPLTLATSFHPKPIETSLYTVSKLVRHLLVHRTISDFSMCR